jgi:hypothetical protein
MYTYMVGPRTVGIMYGGKDPSENAEVASRGGTPGPFSA